MTSKAPNRIARPAISLAIGTLLWLTLFLYVGGAGAQEVKELVIEGGGDEITLSGKIAFAATATGHKEIYICEADGSNVRRITNDSNIAVSPAVSPDGKSVLHTGYRSGFADIYHINLNSGNRRRIIDAPGTNSGAAYSPDGRRIALTMSFVGNPEIFVTSIGGGQATRLTNTSGVETSPTWSADGRQVAFSSDAGGRPQIHIVSASGGASRHLNTGCSHCTEPNWSPDGSKLAFNTRQRGGYAVAVYDFATRKTRLVGRGEDPAWGPDSRHLVYSTGRELVIHDTEGGATTPIVRGLGKISEPNWSRR